jgi:hypothetical protein
MKIRPATNADLRQWFDGYVPTTMRAIVVDDEGAIVGIAGIARMGDHLQAFSGIKPALRERPVTIGRVAVAFSRMLEESAKPIIALCSDDEPTAPGLLSHLGFTQQHQRIWRYG